MKTIYKYELNPNIPQTRLPKGATVLSVGCQGDSLNLWAEVDPGADRESRFFEVYGTGHQISETAGMMRKFIGTVQMHGGSLIWHVFEKVHAGAKP